MPCNDHVGTSHDRVWVVQIRQPRKLIHKNKIFNAFFRVTVAWICDHCFLDEARKGRLWWNVRNSMADGDSDKMGMKHNPEPSDSDEAGIIAGNLEEMAIEYVEGMAF